MGGSTTGSEAAGPAVLPARAVKIASEPAPVPAPHAGAGCEPRVELIRDAAGIQAIDVTCPCGNRIRLRCVY